MNEFLELVQVIVIILLTGVVFSLPLLVDFMLGIGEWLELRESKRREYALREYLRKCSGRTDR